MHAVRVGTSGWNYPSGEGTWNGLFYPASRSKRAGTGGFDELRFYAEHFDTVEVNTTFYGQPRAEVTRTWARRTSKSSGRASSHWPAPASWAWCWWSVTPRSRDWSARDTPRPSACPG